ncbi:MAG: proline iminopeptidase-family hydrolase [Candidatus Riflebacteria bacterium]|nr:proline iminopeptidase-family hydrolase [Candidatus Riflebacteria bacterium]
MIGLLALLVAQGCLAAPARRDVREGFVHVPGGRVWYRIVGAGQKAVPLLVLHGGPGVPHDYLEPLEALADARPVVFYDQLGCGNSDKPADRSLWTIERFVEELVQVRKALGLSRVHILGQSWGSMLAIDYMLTRKPEGVVSLVLSGPCLSTSRWVADTRALVARLPARIRMVIEAAEASGRFDSKEYRQAVDEFFRRHVCRLDPWPDCMNRSARRVGGPVYEHMWGPSEFTVTGTLRGYERVERLEEITTPALFTCGRHDEATPEASALYRDRLPGAQLVVFDGASHEHHLERTALYLHVVGGFLRRTEARTR